MANESKEAAPATDSKPAKGSPVRWAWIGLSLIGLLVPLGWLLLTSSKADRRAPPAPAAPMTSSVAMAGRPNLRLDSLSEGGARFAEDKAGEPSKPSGVAAGPIGPPMPEPTVADVPAHDARTGTADGAAKKKKDVGANAVRDRSPKPAQPAREAARRPSSEGEEELPPSDPPALKTPAAVSPAPMPAPPPPGAPAPTAPKPVIPPPAKPMTAPRASKNTPTAPKPAMKQRGLQADADDMTSDDSPTTAQPEKTASRKQGKKSPAKTASATEGIGIGRAGTIGHGAGSSDPKAKSEKKVGSKQGKSKKPARPAADTDADDAATRGDDPGAEDAEVASLKPGWFGTKIPNPMNLHQATNVYVTVTREENKVKGRAKLEAMPATATPAKIQEDEILVGKFLRVELRALQSEFEIQAISSSEQRLIPGKVTTWQWKVVPLQPGPRELSVVVTNLTDVRGQPIDLTVHAVTVEVEADTMHKLKSVGSLLSSAMGGLMSLFGMYKGILAPLLARRREKDGDAGKGKDKDKDKGGDDGKGKPAAGDAQPTASADASQLPEPPLQPKSPPSA